MCVSYVSSVNGCRPEVHPLTLLYSFSSQAGTFRVGGGRFRVGGAVGRGSPGTWPYLILCRGFAITILIRDDGFRQLFFPMWLSTHVKQFDCSDD